MPLGDSRRDLTIRASITAREAERGAKAVNRAQDSVVRASEEGSKKAVRAQGLVARAVDDTARARKSLERQIDAAERKAQVHGLRGVERLKAQKLAALELARAHGATTQQVERLARAYDQMGKRAADAAARSARGRALGGGASSIGLGTLASQARGFAIAGAAVFAGSGVAGGILENTQRISELSAAQRVLARNTGISEQALRDEVEQIRALNFSTRDALEATSKLAGTGMVGLIGRADELASVARDLATVMGGTTAEALDRLTGAIVKEEVEILETAGLLVKFQTGYDKFAASVGKSSNQLTEQEKLLARFNQVIEAARTYQGTYADSLGTSAGASKELATQWARVNDQIAKMIEPTVATGIREMADALGYVGKALDSIKVSPQVGSVLAITKAIMTGQFTRWGVFGAPEESFGPPRSLMNRPPAGGGGGGGVPPPTRAPGRFDLDGTSIFIERQRVLEAARRPTTESLRYSRGLLGGALTGGGGPLISPQQGPLFGAEALFGGGFNEKGVGDLLQGATKANEEYKRAIEERRRIVEDQNQRLFDSLKYQSGQVFDALLTRGANVWDVFRNAGLTAMREIVSSTVARQLFGVFSGRGGGGGGLGGLFPSLGGFGGIPGAPGGTSGFAGPVGAAASLSGLRGPAASGLGAGASVGLGAALSPALLGFGLTAAATQLPGRGPIAGGIRGGLTGGLATGTLFSLFPSLLAAGPVGAFVAAGIGAGALIGTLLSGARGKARSKVRKAYGIDVKDEGVLGQIVQMGKSFGGSLDAAVQTPAVRELVELYAMATGQSPAGQTAPTLQTGVRLTQRGGLLYQNAQYANGQATVVDSPLPVLGSRAGGTVNVIRLDAQATRDVLAQAALDGVAGAPNVVADAAYRAQQASYVRRKSAALLLEPGTAVSS